MSESTLEVSRKAHVDTSGWADGIAGEKAAEVDHLQNISQILSVDLESDLPAIQNRGRT